MTTSAGPPAGDRPQPPAHRLSLSQGAPSGQPGFAQPGYTDNFFDAIGGHATFVQLVDVFYDGVAEDPLMRPMYPEADLSAAKERLLLFLEQYWGGPRTYSNQRGHPRLRMRHLPFAVTAQARDAWLKHMRDAVDALGLAPLHEATLWDYLERAAHSMVNSA